MKYYVIQCAHRGLTCHRGLERGNFTQTEGTGDREGSIETARPWSTYKSLTDQYRKGEMKV